MTATLIIVVGAITTATRLEKQLSQKSRIQSRIVHTPSGLGGGGCSYSIMTKGENLPIVMEIVKNCKIKVKGYYLAEKAGGKEVYYDIS